MSSKNFDLAMGAAEEYRKLMARNDVVLAEQALRDIDTLVGYWDTSGEKRAWKRPEPVQKIIDSARR